MNATTLLWLKSLHIIFMVTWFAGLFYLPRLFVYHAMSSDDLSLARFQIMERKLYYGITYPGGILTTIFGLWVLSYMPGLLTQRWMQLKLILVSILWVYHISCGYYMKKIWQDYACKSHVFFRFFNEVPVLFLFTIVALVVIKPFLF